jgi:Tol biopolymer transport system component
MAGWILFASNRRGVLSIYRKPVAGGDEEPLLVTEQNINTADISPDGRVMFFSRADPKTLRDLWAKRLDSTDAPFPIMRTPNQDLNGQFAPNGEWLAYQSNESGRYEVSLRKFGSSGPTIQISSDGGTQRGGAVTDASCFISPRPSVDGRTVTFSPMRRTSGGNTRRACFRPVSGTQYAAG